MLLNILLSYTGQFVPNCLQVNLLLDNLMKLHKSDCQYISLNLFFMISQSGNMWFGWFVYLTLWIIFHNRLELNLDLPSAQSTSLSSTAQASTEQVSVSGPEAYTVYIVQGYFYPVFFYCPSKLTNGFASSWNSCVKRKIICDIWLCPVLNFPAKTRIEGRK